MVSGPSQEVSVTLDKERESTVPDIITKSPATLARIQASTRVRAFAYGSEVPDVTLDDALRAYGARKVKLTDFGEGGIVIQAFNDKKVADTRFVVLP